MKRLANSIAERLLAETRGAEIAEAAAVLPLMFMMLLGIFWFGQAFSIYGALTRAAQEGARAGSVPYCATCNPTTTPLQNAATAAQNAMIGSKLDPTQAKYPSTPPALNSCQDGSATTCASGGNPNFCIQNNVQITNDLGATGICGISVSMRYPYKFWLPFTSINNQTIWVSASARVRMENR